MTSVDENLPPSDEEISDLRKWIFSTTCTQRKLWNDEDMTRKTRYAIDAIHEAVNSYPTELLLKLKQEFDGEQRTHTAYHVGGPLDRHKLIDYLNFAPRVKALSMDLMRALVRSLHHYPQLPPHESFSLADDLTVARCLALIKFTIALDNFDYIPEQRTDPHDYTSTIMMIQDPQIVDLALEYPHHADMLAKAMDERQTTDAAFLRSLVEYPVLALHEGIL